MDDLSFEQWNATLRATCGHYYGIAGAAETTARGRFTVHHWFGLDVADIASTAERIERTPAGIRRDDLEHIFLLKQLEGRTMIAHNGATAIMGPGDFVLLDSTRPADLVYRGERSHFLSVHMPRGDFLDWCREAIDIGCVRGPEHPGGRALEAAFPDGRRAPGRSMAEPGFLFDLARIAFLAGGRRRSLMRCATRASRHAATLDVIDRNLTHPDMSLDWLARACVMSPRQLQRDFRNAGTSFTAAVNQRRLKLAADRLRRLAGRGVCPNIADTAMGCGFGDLSHFNRMFKRHFGCRPSDYVAAHRSVRLPPAGAAAAPRRWRENPRPAPAIQAR